MDLIQVRNPNLFKDMFQETLYEQKKTATLEVLKVSKAYPSLVNDNDNFYIKVNNTGVYSMNVYTNNTNNNTTNNSSTNNNTTNDSNSITDFINSYLKKYENQLRKSGLSEAEIRKRLEDILKSYENSSGNNFK